jgi:hypothetical protein
MASDWGGFHNGAEIPINGGMRFKVVRWEVRKKIG